MQNLIKDFSIFKEIDMKKILSIFVCVIILMQGNLLSLGEPVASFIAGYENFNCFHCTTVEDLVRLFPLESDDSRPFDQILEMIVERQKDNVQGAIEYLRRTHSNLSEADREAYICKYFLEGESDAQSYIRKYYTARYENFAQGKSQLLIPVNAAKKIRGVFFFTVDQTFNNALLMCGECLIDTPKEHTFKILSQVWNIIARNFCADSQVLILGVPKAATPIMDKGFIQPAQMKPCEYTGSFIDCEIYDVFKRSIE
jgi:hypothetical protein